MIVSPEDLAKIEEITRLHDEAFDHYQQYDSHAKHSDGHLSIEVSYGNRWDRRANGGRLKPEFSVFVYSYVVASATPLYPDFNGDRNHTFGSLDEALAVMREWHANAMAYRPTDEELAEADRFAAEMWDAIKGRVQVIEIDEDSDGADTATD